MYSPGDRLRLWNQVTFRPTYGLGFYKIPSIELVFQYVDAGAILSAQSFVFSVEEALVLEKELKRFLQEFKEGKHALTT